MTNLRLGYYQHSKGGLYELDKIGRHTETGEDYAVYYSLDEEFVRTNGHPWLRPLNMFLEKVSKGGKEIPRFAYLGDTPEEARKNLAAAKGTLESRV